MTALTCREVDALADFYVLGGLPDAERRAVDAHLAAPGPHACAEAFARARAVAEALLVLPEPVQPDEKDWRTIEDGLRAHIAAERAAAPPAPPVRAASAPPVATRARWPLLVLAAAGWLLAAALVAYLLVRPGADEGKTGTRDTRLGTDGDRAAVLEAPHAGPRVPGTAAGAVEDDPALEELLGIAAAPGARLVPLTPVGEGSSVHGVVVVSASGDRGALLVSGLPAGPRALTVWLTTPAGPPIRAGAVRSPGPRAAAARFDPALLRGEQIGRAHV